MRALHGVIVVLILAMPAPLLAADFQTGLKAFERGDYAADMFPSANHAGDTGVCSSPGTFVRIQGRRREGPFLNEAQDWRQEAERADPRLRLGQ